MSFAGVRHREIGEMRAVERAAGGGVARAVLLQQRAVAVLDLGGAVVGEQLSPSSRRARSSARGNGASIARAAPSAAAGAPTVSARARRHRDRDLGGLMLDRVEPMRIAVARPPAAGCASASERSSAATRLECCASTASTSRSRKRRRSEAGPLNSGSIAGVSQTTRR